jgi:hypothetical protein
MGTTLNVATLIPGRSIEIDEQSRITGVTRKYQVLRATAAPLDAESMISISGLPAIGAAHPSNAALTVSGYRLAEDSNGVRWVIDVIYSRASRAGDRPNRPPRGSAELSRGWTMQDIQIDLVADAVTGVAVLNSAGDPFESVPQVSRAVPVWRREVKESTAVATRLAISGKVNSVAFTVDGVTVGIHCGRLIVSQEKLYDDPDGYASKFTYELALMENKVDIDGTVVDIGWDKAFIECGFFYKDTGTPPTKLRAMEQDAETSAPRPTAAPVLLDADGHRQQSYEPAVVKRVAAIPEVDFSTVIGVAITTTTTTTTTTAG